MTQQFITEHGDTIAGAVLSGSNGRPPAIALIARWLARLDRARRGPRAASPAMPSLIFGRFNKSFRPERTSADWLSRDRAEVDKYLADPLCSQQLLDAYRAAGLTAVTEKFYPEGRHESRNEIKWLNWVAAHAATPPSLAVPTR